MEPEIITFLREHRPDLLEQFYQFTKPTVDYEHLRGRHDVLYRACEKMLEAWDCRHPAAGIVAIQEALFGSALSAPAVGMEALEVMTGGPRGNGVTLQVGPVEISLTCREALRLARDLDEAVSEQLGSDLFNSLSREVEKEPYGPIKLEALASLPSQPGAQGGLTGEPIPPPPVRPTGQMVADGWVNPSPPPPSAPQGAE